jgi:hypothetical protein
MMNLALQNIFIDTSKGFLAFRKSYDMGSTALLPLRKKARCEFLSSLKIHRLDRV